MNFFQPAYQNLNARVESSVNSFLSKQTWRADLNKSQLRETLRKHIHDAHYLEVGVDRIVDQVVNPKVYSVFMPKIEDVVYKFLGIERPKSQRNGACDLKDLLPTDLDPVSPESDRGSIKDESMEIVSEDSEKPIVNGDDQKPSVSNTESKPLEVNASPLKKENIETENEKDSQVMATSPVKALLNTSFKSDEGMKTEEEEEESPDFEPIDILNESNMSNDSHLSGISELTSHRSGSPDFATDFARDNFDCSNQDSQLSKVSSNSRLSIVTDIGSSNHGSTPKSDPKEDVKGVKDNFKTVKESDSNKDIKFNFDVAKIKDNSKTSSSSKESSRDATDFKDGKSKDESKRNSSKDKHESRSSRGRERDSGRRHSSKRRHRSRSKDKTDTDSQESKDFYQKPKEIKIKEIDRKDSDETSDLKDRYKEKIRELREKIELTEKGKLGKMNLDFSKDRKDSVSSKDKEDHKKGSHRSSSSRSSSHHSKSSRSSETKEFRDKSSSRHEERRHTNGKGDLKSSSKSRRDSKSDSRSSDRSRDKRRRDDKKSKPTDDHSSLRKNLNERRSSDRDGSDGSSSKHSQKTSYSANTSSSKFGLTSELTKDNKEQHSSGETDSVHDSLRMTFIKTSDGLLKKVDPGSSEISLPLKKRRLLSEESQDESPSKKKRSSEKKSLKKKMEQLDAFKSDSDVASVPDEERVQIVEYEEEENDQPYTDKEFVLSLEETKKIILDVEPTPPPQSNLSEMELSIQQSLNEMMAEHGTTKVDDIDSDKVSPVKTIPKPNLSEMELSIRKSLSAMMSDHKTSEADDVEPVKVCTVMDSSSLLEALTDDSSTDKDAIIVAPNAEAVISEAKATEVKKSDHKIVENNQESTEKLDQCNEIVANVENVETKENKDISECSKEEKDDLMGIEHQLKQFEAPQDKVKEDIIEKTDDKVLEVPENTKVVVPETEKSPLIKEEQSIENTEKNSDDIAKLDAEPNTKFSEEIKQDTNIEESAKPDTKSTDDSVQEKDSEKSADLNTKITDEITQEKENENSSDECNEEDTLVIDEDVEKEKDCVEKSEATENPIESEQIEENTNNKNSDENQADVVEVHPKDDAADINNKTEEELKEKPVEQVNSEEVNKSSVPEIIENPAVKSSEVTEDTKQEIKDQLINELAKLDKAKNVCEDEIKEPISEEGTSKDDAPMDIIKLDVSSPNSVDTMKMDSDDDSDLDMVEIKSDDELKPTDEKLDDIPEFDPLAEDSMSTDKSEGLTIDEEFDPLAPLARDPLDTEKLDETSNDPLAIDDKTTDLPDEKPIEKVKTNTNNQMDSTDEEDCRYFNSDNQEYLSFKKYLDQLEANATKVIEQKIESPVVEVLVPVLEPLVKVSAPLKRKHSPSPIIENIIQDNNNDGLTSTKQSTVVEKKEPKMVMKKRKVRKMTKSSSSGSVTSSTSQPEQVQQDKEPQAQPVAMVNGENFMMPLSPESDISVSSDKNLGGNLNKEEKRYINVFLC